MTRLFRSLSRALRWLAVFCSRLADRLDPPCDYVELVTLSMSGGVEADTRSRRDAGMRGAGGGPCESSVTRMGHAGVASGPLTDSFIADLQAEAIAISNSYAARALQLDQRERGLCAQECTRGGRAQLRVVGR